MNNNLPPGVKQSDLDAQIEPNELITLTLELNGQTLYREVAPQFFDNDMDEVGEWLTDLYETLKS